MKKLEIPMTLVLFWSVLLFWIIKLSHYFILGLSFNRTGKYSALHILLLLAVLFISFRRIWFVKYIVALFIFIYPLLFDILISMAGQNKSITDRIMISAPLLVLIVPCVVIYFKDTAIARYYGKKND